MMSNSRELDLEPCRNENVGRSKWSGIRDANLVAQLSSSAPEGPSPATNMGALGPGPGERTTGESRNASSNSSRTQVAPAEVERRDAESVKARSADGDI